MRALSGTSQADNPAMPELRHVGQVDPDPDHVVQVLADRRQSRRDAAQDLVGLLGDVAVDQLAGGRAWATCPDRKSSSPPRTATENGRPDGGSWSLVTASRVMAGEFLSLMC